MNPGTYVGLVLSPRGPARPSCRLLLVALARRWWVASTAELSRDTGLTERTVRDLVTYAVEEGWLLRGQKRGFFVGKTPHGLYLESLASGLLPPTAANSAHESGNERRGGVGGVSSDSFLNPEYISQAKPEEEEAMVVPVPANAQKAPLNRKKPAKQEENDQFESWWLLVPRRVNKGGARRAFLRALRGGKVSYPDLEAATRSWALSVALRVKREGPDALRFTPHPATWLNGERWLDTEVEGAAEPSFVPRAFQDEG